MIVKYASKQFCEFMKNAGDKKILKKYITPSKEKWPKSKVAGKQEKKSESCLKFDNMKQLVNYILR